LKKVIRTAFMFFLRALPSAATGPAQLRERLLIDAGAGYM
jgi:hypothetical protein